MPTIKELVAEEKTAGGVMSLQDIIIGVVILLAVIGLFQNVIAAMNLPSTPNTTINTFFTNWWNMAGLFTIIVLLVIVAYMRLTR